MITELLAITNFGLVIFDSIFTTWRMNEIGNNVELNPIVRGVANELGAITGSLIGILLPNIAVLSAAVYFHADNLLSFILGMRTLLTIRQLASIQHPS